MQPAAVVTTEFELQVRHLRLTKEKYVSSAELRRWWLSMSLPLTEKEEAYEATRKLLTQAAALT